MKKITLLAALVCGASFSGMAGTGKTPIPESMIYKSTEILNKKSGVLMRYNSKFVFDFNCYNIMTGCGVEVIACGSTTREVINAAILFESIVCD